MEKGRLEAFSDGVIAIIITIMVLELKAPKGGSWDALWDLRHEFFSYVLSFIYVGIYWNNHHHMLKAADKVNGGILWANLHLLFWLSLVPFTTAWVAKSEYSAAPITLYGANLLLAAIAYIILQWTIICAHGKEASLLRTALGSDRKGKLSAVLYATAIALSFWWKWAAFSLYVLVALIWLVPDRRISRVIK
jgi:uncharacterized membrane protein